MAVAPASETGVAAIKATLIAVRKDLAVVSVVGVALKFTSAIGQNQLKLTVRSDAANLAESPIGTDLDVAMGPTISALPTVGSS